MRKSPLLLLVLAALTALLTLGGCGGNEPSAHPDDYTFNGM